MPSPVLLQFELRSFQMDIGDTVLPTDMYPPLNPRPLPSTAHPPQSSSNSNNSGDDPDSVTSTGAPPYSTTTTTTTTTESPAQSGRLVSILGNVEMSSFFFPARLPPLRLPRVEVLRTQKLSLPLLSIKNYQKFFSSKS